MDVYPEDMVSDRPNHPDDVAAWDPHANAGGEDREAIDALKAAIASREFAAATATLRQAWFDLLSRHGHELRLALDTVPASGLHDFPLLALALGICYNGVPHRRVKALRHFATAVRATRSSRQELDPVDRALILASESVAYRLIGHPAMGVGPARASIRALDAMSAGELATVTSLPRIYSQVGISLYYGSAVDDALAAFVTGLAEAQEAGSPDGFGNVSMLAGVHALRGDLPEALTYIELARDGQWTDTQRSMYPGTFYRIAEAVAALERFDPATASTHLDAMAHDARTIEHWVPIAQTRALASLLAGRPGEGLSRLDAYATTRTEGRSTATRDALGSVRALLRLALGNHDAAGVILRRDVAAGPVRDVASARLELVLGHNGAALRELRKNAGADLPSRLRANATAIEAAALLRLSTSPRTGAVIEHLGSLLEHTGQRMALALLPPADLDRVRAALVDSGFAHLFADVPVRSVLPEVSLQKILTEREIVVLTALMRTSSPVAIAAELVVSVNTVKTQLRSIYRKLGVSNRDDAIAIALDLHLLAE